MPCVVHVFVSTETRDIPKIGKASSVVKTCKAEKDHLFILNYRAEKHPDVWRKSSNNAMAAVCIHICSPFPLVCPSKKVYLNPTQLPAASYTFENYMDVIFSPVFTNANLTFKWSLAMHHHILLYILYIPN